MNTPKAPGYRWEYVDGAYGTERAVIVYAPDGRVIGCRDPFHGCGVPALSRARVSRCREVATEIVREQERSTEK